MDTTNNIPSGKYDGYYWLSDANEPKVLEGSALPSALSNMDASQNPFIIEARLFNPATGDSFGINYIDGAYVVRSYKVSEEDMKRAVAKKSDTIVLKRYIANRMPGKKLKFLQYWREVEDPLCAGMPVLQPAEMVFVGFETIETESR
ncbi:MAG: TIGR04423 family type III CRISPR-associated protein [Muribaculaceae bacterium]|nr:TIGR04423 family type III CRISPR-associated protein [Muribaculaceae bacterium]